MPKCFHQKVTAVPDSPQKTEREYATAAFFTFYRHFVGAVFPSEGCGFVEYDMSMTLSPIEGSYTLCVRCPEQH